MDTPHPRGGFARAGFPWPYVRLSNGFEIEVQERLVVRSLIDSDRPKMKRGSRAGIVHWPPGQLTLIKFSSGSNVRYNDIKENAVEGIDFEVIPGEKLEHADIKARALIAHAQNPETAAAREERELNDRYQDEARRHRASH